ncbi:L,D-transpeptidase [Denitrificimonas sp. JX-1]|uniref:L,D-transpeptidase n=1 Tax=Denitrificimonas halotolerans TaxID=3098930 RepID=A0ABU5GQ70_9GAMM|nr:L,D-transpeptidase [Denitrificimonas sp. JX-1]MDY7219144.1 L,D-transpeptidase [Denitrificimonas sp. JX-1]
MIDYLHVSIAEQRLYAFSEQQLQGIYTVSTALNGPGEKNGSGCTPRGRHYVRAKIGTDLPAMAVLRGRRWTGEIWTPELHQAYPERDWILSRILWLSGCELGRNRLGSTDTFRRYIYIHGTADEHLLGQACSHGCIRMANQDLIELYIQLGDACPVDISVDATQAQIMQAAIKESSCKAR